MNVLVTGGAGYIGSHAAKLLLTGGHNVTILDTLEIGHAEAVRNLRTLDQANDTTLAFAQHSTAEREAVTKVLRDRDIECVMHFAAYALVGESVTNPLKYHRNNTGAAIELLEACDAAGVSKFIFSSTCASYGEPSEEHIPIKETTPQSPINPYGNAKLAFEKALMDFRTKREIEGRPFACAILRYFNVAGSDPDVLIGEDHDPETHLIPIILQAALGKRAGVTIFGTDYPTPDGTCIRDYVHVQDLVAAHATVMQALGDYDLRIYNLGIGKGLSVREIIEAAKQVTGVDFAVSEGERRAGDPPTLYADPSKIRSETDWVPRYTDVNEIIKTAWDWFKAHPDGYDS
jgi:UDP-glucose 4-epimerase